MRPFFNSGYFPPENVDPQTEDSAGRIQIADDYLDTEYEAAYQADQQIEVLDGPPDNAIQIADDY